MRPILEIARSIGIPDDCVEPYGQYMAKISLRARDVLKERRGRLILVTATTPTPSGEGKTTNAIGLSMALNRLGYSAVVTLREPSLGPVFGVKGGAAGGGRSQVLPSERINLLFTGDFPAVSAAHNLLAAMIDNHIYQGNALGIDVVKVSWPRTVDMNDRALREIVVALGQKNGIPRETSFVITAASEVMAILALAKDYEDLRERLGRIVVGATTTKEDVCARDLKADGAMSVLLRDALMPNLVQTSEGTPAIVHTGPFANIAHGTNSVIAIDMALRLFDYVVVEAGFGADLGAEKFVNIVSRVGNFNIDAVALITSIRALEEHGKGDLRAGFPNLEVHAENIHSWGLPLVVVLNRFPDDTSEKIDILRKLCQDRGWQFEVSEVYAKGSEGGLSVARAVVEAASKGSELRRTYELSDSIKSKIEKVAKQVYHASRVSYSEDAESQLRRLEKRGYGSLPVCIAKTQFSISDNPKLKGRPSGFEVSVREVELNAGAGFIVVLMGDILRMPGLPKQPAAEGMSIDENGEISGVF